MEVLLIGGGGREDALHWKLTEEGHEVIAAPGNPGMAKRGRVVSLNIYDHKAVSDFVKSEGIGFTVVGPEAPLAAGIVDHFDQVDLPIFGPTKRAADIETSKNFTCGLLRSARVPIPFTKLYDNFEVMKNTVLNSPGRIVLKKSGLAAGKGAEVIRTKADLPEALARLARLGDGPYQVQVMEEGPELSYF